MQRGVDLSSCPAHQLLAGDRGHGVEPSRVTIEAFLQYCDEQGVTHRKLTPEELYAPEALSEFVI